jgi:hypothetical protein
LVVQLDGGAVETDDAALLEALGEEQTRTLAAQGAELGITDAVAYLRTEANRALAPS